MILWCLWSINERLAGRPGLDLPQPDLGSILTDLVSLAGLEAEEWDRAKKNRD